MLLRVDQVSGGNSPNDPKPPTTPPLHACLASATFPSDNASPSSSNSQSQPTQPSQVVNGNHLISDNESNANSARFTGEILKIGRKNCAVTIDDKCVSRNHASIRLISQNSPPSSTARSPTPDGRILMEYGSPSTPEEVRACETSALGVVAVIKDLGSKFGTFVSVDDEVMVKFDDAVGATSGGAVAGGTGGDDDETGDDETDDGIGGAAVKPIQYVDLSEKQSRAVQLLLSQSSSGSESNDSSKQAIPKFQKLEPNSTSILIPLSHSHLVDNASKSPHVIILFGPQGSAIRLSLPPNPLKFTFSRIPSKVQEPIIASLHYIGATHSPQWDVQKSTHLVTPVKLATAKHIMAWACRRPVVTVEYIYALLGRKSPNEELPDEAHYPPEGKTQLDDIATTAEPCRVLKGYRFGVLLDDDSAPLAQSAGGDVIFIYDKAPSTSQSEFDRWWCDQMQRASRDKMALVVVDSSSKKCKTFREWLNKKEDAEEKDRVRFTTAKNLAKAITSTGEAGELLLDSWGDPIEKLSVFEEEDAKEISSPPKEAEPIVAEKIAGDQKEKDEIQSEEPVAASDPPEDVAFDNHDDIPDESIEKGETSSSQTEKASTGKGKSSSTERYAVVEKPPTSQEINEMPSKQKRVRDQVKEQSGQFEQSKRKRTDETQHPKSSNRHKIDKDDERKEVSPSERKHLEVTEDGWFVAAPPKRIAYRNTAKELEDMGVEGDLQSAAQTQFVSGLIVRDYIPPNTAGSSGRVEGSQNGRLVSRSKKKDFKRFRKNNVIRGYSSFTPTYSSQSSHHSSQSIQTIRLVSVLPKESERQRQLEIQQQELEREQEFADALFNDGGGGMGKTGRGKSGAGGRGIRNYFSQTPAKRGRARR